MSKDDVEGCDYQVGCNQCDWEYWCKTLYEGEQAMIVHMHTAHKTYPVYKIADGVKIDIRNAN